MVADSDRVTRLKKVCVQFGQREARSVGGCCTVVVPAVDASY